MANKAITDLETVSPSATSTVVGEKDGVVARFNVSELGGSSGGGGGIVTVDALPTEGKEDTIYRVAKTTSAQMANWGWVDTETVVVIVAKLPETGEPEVVYFSTTEQMGYLYINEEMASEFGVDVGWYESWEVSGEKETAENAGHAYKVSTDPADFAEGQPYYGWLLNTEIALYHYYNGKYIKLVDENESGIIDVDTLPTENIDASAIYRLSQVSVMIYAKYASGQVVQKPAWVVEVVDTLPEIGNTCVSVTSTLNEYWYYQKSDDTIYGYADADLASSGGVTVGWYTIDTVYGLLHRTITMIHSESDITDEGYYALVTKTVDLYHYCDGEFSKIITSKNFEFDETTGTLVLNL